MPEPFRDALRERMPLAYATGAIAALMTVVWLLMTLGGAFSDPSGLIGWGASFGPLTTNGEWWRLGASVLVHAGFFHFVVNLIGFVQPAIVVERMVGHAAFAVVFLAAGLFAGLESLSAMPMAVVAGADGAIFGIYGLFAAAVVWNIRRPAPEELLQLGDLRSSSVDDGCGGSGRDAGAAAAADDPGGADTSRAWHGHLRALSRRQRSPDVGALGPGRRFRGRARAGAALERAQGVARCRRERSPPSRSSSSSDRRQC